MAQLGVAALALAALGALLSLAMGQALIAMLAGAAVATMRFLLGLLPLG